MHFDHEFTLTLPKERAWRLLTDLPRIAPCMPGALLERVEGCTYSGAVSVRVGPITTKYCGAATVVDLDDAACRMVLEGKGAESSGGGATARMSCQLADLDGARTRVTVATDLQLSGRVAQFGQGMIKEVSSRLLQQFVRNLEASLAAEPSASPGAEPAAVELPPPVPPALEPQPVDIGRLAAASLARYGLPASLALIILLQILILIRQ